MTIPVESLLLMVEVLAQKRAAETDLRTRLAEDRAAQRAMDARVSEILAKIREERNHVS